MGGSSASVVVMPHPNPSMPPCTEIGRLARGGFRGTPQRPEQRSWPFSSVVGHRRPSVSGQVCVGLCKRRMDSVTHEAGSCAPVRRFPPPGSTATRGGPTRASPARAAPLQWPIAFASDHADCRNSLRVLKRLNGRGEGWWRPLATAAPPLRCGRRPAIWSQGGSLRAGRALSSPVHCARSCLCFVQGRQALGPTLRHGGAERQALASSARTVMAAVRRLVWALCLAACALSLGCRAAGGRELPALSLRLDGRDYALLEAGAALDLPLGCPGQQQTLSVQHRVAGGSPCSGRLEVLQEGPHPTRLGAWAAQQVSAPHCNRATATEPSGWGLAGRGSRRTQRHPMPAARSRQRDRPRRRRRGDCRPAPGRRAVGAGAIGCGAV